VRPLCALVLLALAATASAARAEDPCREVRYGGDLTALFAPARELGADWETVREAPSDPAQDPELAAAGVVAVQSLHYGRPLRGGAETCSLEVWGFASAAAARRTRGQVGFPGWRFGLRGNLLWMVHGVAFSPAHGFRPGLLPECQRLADLAEARAGALLGCGGRP
jgi:hypothetical protein